MDKKIVGILRPFDMQQLLYVFDGSEKIDTVTTTIDELSENIFILSDKYSINQVDITGPKTYSEHIIQDCQQAEITKYSKNILNFTLI